MYDNLDTLLLLVDVLDADACSNQMSVLKALVETGELESLKKLAQKPGWFTGRRIKDLVKVSTAAGHVEITAWLLDQLDSRKKGDDEGEKSEAVSALSGSAMTAKEAKTLFTLKNIGTDAVAISAYKGTDVNVEIPALIGSRRVVAIGKSAFDTENARRAHRAYIKTIKLPEGLVCISEQAFRYCDELRSVEMPLSVRSIEEKAFEGCYALNDVVLNEGLERIGFEAFAGCEALKSLVIPSSVKSIGEGAFSYCNGLRRVEIKNSEMQLSDDVFDGCNMSAIEFIRG